ncbi:ABC transporter substrate-binding protein [Robbsia sp. KACC 23696]|uniref:ABC transporter substrate-binding protein n=1 Tax=Robbsia sp. KACC 23696 TaxID=3149231 RepID=UPI00325B186F
MKRAALAALMSVTIALAASMTAHAQTVVNVGSTPTGSPFTFLDTKTNQIEGIMVDIANAVAKDAGFQVKIEPMQFSALIGSLTSKRIDMISAAMFITPARKEVVDFSVPVYSYGEGVVVPTADKTAYTSLADLKGKRIGVQVGTAFVAPLQKSGLFSEVRLYDTTADLMRDVNAGRIDVGMLDAPIAGYALSQGRFPNLRMVTSYKPTIVGSLGFATNKDNPALLARIDAAVTKLKADGTIAAILKKWGMDS